MVCISRWNQVIILVICLQVVPEKKKKINIPSWLGVVGEERKMCSDFVKTPKTRP